MFSLAQGDCFAHNPEMSAHLNPEKASTSPWNPVGEAPIHLSIKPSCLLIAFSLLVFPSQLARQGLNVVLISRTMEKLQAIAVEIGE